MPTLLHLDSSPLESSISRELTREFVKTWKAAHPDGSVIYRDVAAHTPKPLDAAWTSISNYLAFQIFRYADLKSNEGTKTSPSGGRL